MVSIGSSAAKLNRKEAAAYLRSLGYPVEPRTLARLATMKKGPPYTRFMHRTVLYDKSDLTKWAESQMEEVVTAFSPG